MWAAMRLRPGEAAVVANAFVLRGVPDASGQGADGREYLVSPRLRAAAAAHGLEVFETPAGELDWFAT